MAETITRDKNPVFVESGRRGARKRWGEPRVVRLGELPEAERRIILSLVEGVRRAQAAVPSEPAA
jgi:hypothetical protein